MGVSARLGDFGGYGGLLDSGEYECAMELMSMAALIDSPAAPQLLIKWGKTPGYIAPPGDKA